MSRLKRNVVANFIGSALGAATAFLFIPLYVRILGIEAYGLVGFSATLIVVLGVADVGVSTTLNRQLARLSASPDPGTAMRRLLHTTERLYMLVPVVIVPLIILFAPWIASNWVNARGLPLEQVTRAVRLIGLLFAFQWPASLYSGGLLGLQRQVLYNVINVVAALVRSVAVLFVLWTISPTIEAFFLFQAFVWLAHVLVARYFLWRSLPPASEPVGFDLETLRPVWRFAAGTSGIIILGILIMQADKLIVSKLVPLATFGYYTVGSAAGWALYRFVTPIFTAVFPRLSQLVASGDDAGLRALYHKSCQWIAIAVVPTATILALFSREVLLIWTGDPVTAGEAYLVMSFITIGTGLNGLLNVPYGLQLASGITRLSFYGNLIGLTLLVPTLYLLVSRWGAPGAAAGWMLLNVGVILISMPAMHRLVLHGELARWYAYDVLIPIAGSLAVALPARLLMPDLTGRLPLILWVAGSSALTMTAAVFVTSAPREWLLQRLRHYRRYAVEGSTGS